MKILYRSICTDCENPFETTSPEEPRCPQCRQVSTLSRIYTEINRDRRKLLVNDEDDPYDNPSSIRERGMPRNDGEWDDFIRAMEDDLVTTF